MADLTGYYRRSYTNNVWTDWAAAPSGGTLVLRKLNILNTDLVTTLYVDLRVVDSVGAIKANTWQQIRLTAQYTWENDTFMALINGERLQMRCAAAGIEFAAWGGYE